MHTRKRRVHFYVIEMKSYAHANTGITNPAAAHIGDMLNSFASLGTRLPVEIAKTKQISTMLADWKHDHVNGYYEILLNKADANLSDVAFRRLDNKALRKAGKEKIEGIETSSHVLLRPNQDGRTATVLMTMGAGISIGDVCKLFRLLSKAAVNTRANRALFFFDHPSGERDAKGKAVQYRVSYQFLHYGFMGLTLDQALRSGEFECLELIAHDTDRFDTTGNLQIQERSLKITSGIPQTVTGASIRNAIRAFKSNPDGAFYDTARIHYKSPSGKSSTASLPIQDLDAAFTYSENITFDTDVEAQQASLSPTVLEKMRPLLKALP